MKDVETIINNLAGFAGTLMGIERNHSEFSEIIGKKIKHISEIIELVKKQQAKIDCLKAEQPKKGEWIIDEYGIHHCPFCKAINETVYQNFCPNCGADMRMDGEKE